LAGEGVEAGSVVGDGLEERVIKMILQLNVQLSREAEPMTKEEILAAGLALEFRPTARAFWEKVEAIEPQGDGRWQVASWSHGYTDIEAANIRPKSSDDRPQL
jgi:hypothetical protein